MDGPFSHITEGKKFTLDTLPITREAIIDFASRFDPQPFHLDDAAAAANPIFGRLSASGWHTVAVANVLLDRCFKKQGLIGVVGIGADAIRWLKPVFAGDVLGGEVEIASARVSSRRSDYARVSVNALLNNQDAQPVASLQLTGLFASSSA